MAKLKILILEDTIDVRDAYDLFFRSEGYLTFLAKDGPEALELQKENVCDVAIVDVMLQTGGMNGFAVSSEIKRTHPETIVIIVTGLQDSYTDTRYLDSKANKILRKPVSGDEIISEIDYINRKKHLHDQGIGAPRPLISSWVVIGCAVGLYALLQFGWMTYQSANEAATQRLIAVEQQTRQAQIDTERQERKSDFQMALADKMAQDKEIAKMNGFIQGSKK